MNKKIKLSFTQDEVEIISELLRLETQERQQQFANIIGDEELNQLSNRVWAKTIEGEEAIKEARLEASKNPNEWKQNEDVRYQEDPENWVD